MVLELFCVTDCIADKAGEPTNERAGQSPASSFTGETRQSRANLPFGLAVEDVKKVSDKHCRAKAVLSNVMDMPITIEERDDDYIYVTLAPLSNLLE